MKTQPWSILLAMMAGWLNRHQQDVITYLKAENAVLKEKIGKKRIVLSDEQRIRLAMLGKNIWGNRGRGNRGQSPIFKLPLCRDSQG